MIALQWLKWLFATPVSTGHAERLEAVTVRIENAGKRIEKSADSFDEFGRMVVGMREKKSRKSKAKSGTRKGPKPKC